MAEDRITCEEWIGDDEISLRELENLIPRLKERYGANAMLKFDAGYNNVSVMIRPTKKVKPKKAAAPALPPREHFARYVKVQYSNRYNMFDPCACRATGLSREEFGAVQDNYDALAEKYPDVVRDG